MQHHLQIFENCFFLERRRRFSIHVRKQVRFKVHNSVIKTSELSCNGEVVCTQLQLLGQNELLLSLSTEYSSNAL